jgi:Tfp pilus assembly protein PilP
VKRKRFNKRSLTKKAISCIVSAVFLSIAGCGGGGPTAPLSSKPRAVTGDKRAPGPASTEAKNEAEKKEEEYSYDASGKADPFKPFIQLTPVKEASRNIPLTPLQRYEVSQLRLVAILSTPEGNVALVEDSSGKGFFLKKGTYVGKNDGRVTKILKDKVFVEEVYPDVFGHPKQSEVALNLYQTEEGGEP